MADDDPVKRFYELTDEAFSKFNMNIHEPREIGRYLEAAGFRNIRCVVKKVPIGPWARDPTLRIVGWYMKTAIETVLPSVAGKPFEALGMSLEERTLWPAVVRKSLNDATRHRYCHYYFWCAQK